MNTPAPIRPDKDVVIALVTQFAPEFLEILADCKNADTWRKLAARFSDVCKRLKVENYVLMYEDARRIHSALFNGLMSQEEQAAWVKELTALSREDQQKTVNEWARPGGEGEQIADAMFPNDPEAEQEQIRAFESLSEDDRREATRRGQYLYAFFFAFFHDALAVMVHGEKMTSLVPKALAGDKEAFGKAVHIDKSLFYGHSDFRAIHSKAIQEGDQAFLDAVARRQGAPVTQGRIRLAGAFVVFSLLEAMGWLDDFLYREILDICDAAKLDRWQNRIEDETAIAKCIKKYGRYQKSGGVSMH